jgi:hypothetical protein
MQKGREPMMDDAFCANCGLEKNAWADGPGAGYTLDEVWYCCQGCADESGCTCAGCEVLETEELPAGFNFFVDETLEARAMGFDNRLTDDLLQHRERFNWQPEAN